MRSIRFAKGHGTLNDFVVLVDRHDTLGLSDADVALLCDRQAGLGADGLLRAVKAEHVPEWDGDPDVWFMDYRNADGSRAEMCGNGTRVFVQHLLDHDLVARPEVAIGTRAGLRIVRATHNGLLTTEMGDVRLATEPVRVTLGERTWPATHADVGNPHAVVLLPPGSRVNELDLDRAPTWAPPEAFPNGANVEFVEAVGDRHLAMRVHERGVGETLSCGTGAVAAAAAHARASGLGDGEYRVDVAGGVLAVDLRDGRASLAGPATILAHGEVHLPDRHDEDA